MARKSLKKNKALIGWREWVALPELGIGRIKAKIDTGARTSALDSWFMEEFEENGIARVRFRLRDPETASEVEPFHVADVVESRSVTDSGGHRETRVVIRTPLVIGDWRHRVEITLTCRKTMRFRMLIGRTAIRKHFQIDAARSFLAGEPAASVSNPVELQSPAPDRQGTP